MLLINTADWLGKSAISSFTGTAVKLKLVLCVGAEEGFVDGTDEGEDVGDEVGTGK